MWIKRSQIIYILVAFSFIAETTLLLLVSDAFCLWSFSKMIHLQRVYDYATGTLKSKQCDCQQQCNKSLCANLSDSCNYSIWCVIHIIQMGKLSRECRPAEIERPKFVHWLTRYLCAASSLIITAEVSLNYSWLRYDFGPLSWDLSELL